jgi:hypothetical protein
VAVVCAPFVFPFLFVYCLHFLLESHLLHQLLHLALVVGLASSILIGDGSNGCDVIGIYLAEEVSRLGGKGCD